MTVTNETKNFFSVTLAQNEVFDRNYFSDKMGPGLGCVIYFEGAGNLEFSADQVSWITDSRLQNVLFPTDIAFPQFIRPAGVGNTTIHFKLN